MESNSDESAFPVPADSVADGMTLRDYFAAKAMQAILTHKEAFNDMGETQIAEMAYNQADAMLKARKEKPSGK